MGQEGYVARLPSSVVLRSQVPSGQAGMALAQGIAGLGQALGRVADQNTEANEQIAASNHRIAMEQKRRDQSAIQAIAIGRKSDIELAMQQDATALRTKTTDEAATGHLERVTAMADKRAGEFVDWLAQASGNDPEVMDRLVPMIHSARNNVLGDESAWQMGERAKAQGNGIAKAGTAIKNAQLTMPNPEKAVADLTQLHQIVFSSDLPFSAKAKAWDDIQYDVLAGGTLDGLIQTGNIAGAQHILASGMLDDVLGDSKGQWMKRVDAGAREQALEAERAASGMRTAALDGLKSIKVDIENDGEVKQGTIVAAFNAAKAAGVKEADLKDFAYLAEGAEQARAMRGMTTPQLQASAEQLRGKLNAGQATGEDKRRLDRAEKALDQRDSKDGESLSSLWKQGAQGQMAAMAQLAGMPLDQRERVTAKMGQESLAIVAGLKPETQGLALTGLQVRAARGKDYLPPSLPHKSGEDAVREAFDAIVGGSIKNGLSGQYKAMIEAAMNVYVGAQATHGKTQGWERDGFEKAVKIAFGATRRADGTWQGGLGTVRGRKVELPNRWNESEVDARISRFDFAGAGAVYANGAAASRADVTANYRPVFDHMDPDGTAYYRFEGRQATALFDAKAKRVFLLPFADRGAR